MNNYTFEQLSIGMEASFETCITDSMMDAFKALSGDVNPLHCDEAYAQSQRYPGRVVYGMLTSSFYSTLAGVYLPGQYCLLHEVNSSFNKPVFIGDSLTVSGKITEINDTFRFVKIKSAIINQNGEKVSKAVIVAGVTK